MSNKFVILNNGKLETYTNFDDIPEKFDNLIQFLPKIPSGPHTPEEHLEIGIWNGKLRELLKRETNGNNTSN